MTIDVINTALPPQFDAIGHYTALFCEELAHSVDVRLLVPTGPTYDPIANVPILPCFSVETPEGIQGILEPIIARQPNWVLLQYNPFLYGKRGYAPQLIPTLRELKRRCPKTRIAAMVHENFAWGIFKLKVMATWQIPMYFQLGRLVDQLFISTDTWSAHCQLFFPNAHAQHLPVGSTIPNLRLARDEARARLQIPENVFAIGVFGTAHISRMLNRVTAVVRAARAQGKDARLLYVGPDGVAVREALGELEPICTDGPLPFEEISKRFAAMDIYLAPFRDGVATRRTSLMASMQHGIASVGTSGPSTDKVLADSHERGLLLAPAHDEAAFIAAALRLVKDPALRQRIGEGGRALYEEKLTPSQGVQSFLAALGEI